MKLNRRQILLAGLAAGLAATGTKDLLQAKANRKRQAELAALAEVNTDSLLEAAFAADSKKVQEGLEIQASARLTPPSVAYNRQLSKRLILCSKLATQQYITGKINPAYDGSINSLKDYDKEQLAGYTQLAVFRGHEQEITEKITLDVPPPGNAQDSLDQDADMVEANLRRTVQQVVKLRRQIPVYFGFALTSKSHNILVFRGTQRTTEWVQNFAAIQEPFKDDRTGQDLGRVHRGFLRVYRGIVDPLIPNLAAKLDPSVPCYVSGHSLGAALANLAAIDIALHVPQIRHQLQVYTYAGPRVGDLTFAKAHSQLIPNNYRVVNLADAIPLMPPTKFREVFIHLGQEWSFLSQYGDIMPNHVVDTYRDAVDREVETDQLRHYPVSGV